MNASAETMRPASVTRLPNWTELNRQWLIAAIAKLRERIEARTADMAGEGEAADCIDANDATGFMPALVHCARVFRLSPLERELLLLVAGLELDHGLRAAVTNLNLGVSSRASYGLALAVLTATALGRAFAQRPPMTRTGNVSRSSAMSRNLIPALPERCAAVF
jgi:hypothetical protein